MAKVEGGICPKGQAGLQTAYDPYRIINVLKRKSGTKRGDNQWASIPFAQATDVELVSGLAVEKPIRRGNTRRRFAVPSVCA